MINDLLDEIIKNIEDNIDKNKFKIIKFSPTKSNDKTGILIYKKEDYLKHPFINIIFYPDSTLHIDTEVVIEPLNKKTTKYGETKNFVLIVNQYHPDSMYISKENNEIEIADFIDYIKSLLDKKD